MPPIDKSLHRLKLLLEACARRDPRYQSASNHASRNAGSTPGDFAKLLDFSECSDADLFQETRHHLNSMLVNCVTGTGHKPDLHKNLQMIESAIPVPKPKPRP